MSQVIRKYNSGGQTDKPKLLSVKGLGDFNQDDLIKRGYRDVDEYASSKGLGNTAAADFRNAVQYMLEGISNGTMTMDAMGNFQDATGQKSSTGELDRKKFLGIKTGVKNTENNAYGLAADYLYNIIKGSPQYKQPEVKKERFNANKLMEDAISREWYGGNAIDYNNWFRNRTEQDRNALMGRIWDSADYNQIFQSHDWSGTNIKSAEDLAALGRAYGAAITNNKLDNDDYNTFAALGGTGLDKFIRPTQQATTPQSSTVEGQQGKVDTSWTNSEYDRTVDDKGKYHIYKKGTNEEVSGILPGNVFKGVGNRYAFDGNIYDDSNLPEQYRQDITRARQAQLGEYTSLTDNNPFTKMLKGQGYNYITNLSQFASGVGNNVLYGAYSNPSDVNGKMGFYLKNPTTGKTTRGSVELNKSLGEYQFIGEDGNVINLGAYNPNGARERQGVKFVDYTDTSKANWENLFNTWMQDPDLSNPASEAYRMVQNTLSKWIDSKQSPFVKYGKDYKWAVGDNDMNVARNNDGTLSWYFNNKVESEDESSNELRRLLSIPIAERSREINDRILKLQGYKKGGVISAQLGTKFIEDTTPLKVSAVQPDAEQIERNTKARQSFTGRSNVSLGNNKDITDAGGVIKTSDKLEGDKAIKPESVSVDTKYFGRRPQSEEVEGTKTDGNWFSNSSIGKHIAGYRDPSVVRGSENIPFSDAWFLKKGSTKPKSVVQSKSINETADAVSSMIGALHTASKFRQAPLALPAPGQVTPSNRVFYMGSGKPKAPKDVTNPSNLKKPGSYTDRTVPVGGIPVQSPNAKAVRTINSVSSILEPFIPKSNLPAVIPASRNAQKVVASQTIQPSQRLDQFIGGQIPGGRQFGRQRAKTEREYRDVFHPAAEREYNQVWDEAIKNRKDFGYEEVSPKRSPYTPPTPTEVYVEPKGAIKDPNARYLWELINRKSSTSHIKRDNLPHKGKSKKKKTSKDDRVTKKAEGGLIQFLQGGNTVGRIKAKDMSSWNRSKALSGYDFGADADRWKSQYTGSDDWRQAYAAAFNGGEDIYDQLTSMTGNYFGGNYNYSVQDPLAKHRQVTFRGTNQGFDDLIRKGIVGYGTTEGNSGFDVYAGDRTGNRTLGRGMSADDVARFNEQLRARGLELYDKGDGGYRLRPLQDPANELGEVVVTAPRVSNTSNPSDIRRTPGSTKKGLKLNVAPEEVLALGRMVGGLAANNRAARIYKEGLKPTLLDTFENTVPLQGNFQAVTNAEQQAGNLESVAARPRTSDASLQLAGELEASGRAGQARFQGGLQDAEMFYKTRMLGQQESDAAKARRVEVANRNRASMNAIDAAKKQIDAGRVTANYQQVIAPYLAGVENRFRQTKAMRDQLALESYLNEANSNYNTSAAKIMEDYKDDPIGAQRELSKLQKGLQSDMLKKRSSLISTPWLVQFSGKGSKLSYAERAMLQRAKDFNKRLSDDNKQFHKDVMESKREHNKMIANMSALTAALIKKGMQL